MQRTLKMLLVLLLGGWLGASVFFTFVAAPALFRLGKQGAITAEQAGDVAGALLNLYFPSALIALALALLAGGYLALSGGASRFKTCALVTLVALLVTGFSYFVWSPKVHEAREQRRANRTAVTEKQFRVAHHVSFGMNLVMIAGTAWAFALAARPE
jgi:Ca2+/H+ antiporter